EDISFFNNDKPKVEKTSGISSEMVKMIKEIGC
ncbi:unnamed protein product, partial [marine sediment metagenome]